VERCPVCPYDGLTPADLACPGCGHDLTLLRRVQELPLGLLNDGIGLMPRDAVEARRLLEAAAAFPQARAQADGCLGALERLVPAAEKREKPLELLRAWIASAVQWYVELFAPRSTLGVTAKAIVRRPDGRLLLIKRSPDAKSDPDCWDLPGGKLVRGETLADALARKTFEETGLLVEVGLPVHICHSARAPFWITRMAFVCETDEADVHLDGGHADFAWVEPSELPDRRYARAAREQLDVYAAWRRGS
jgi:8-oxo-dGTP diphosphatase